MSPNAGSTYYWVPYGGVNRAEASVDRHLNAFIPYERAPGHEDQLTRAAMIVVRAVPLALDCLLARIGLPSSGQLPRANVDMQTGHVVHPPADDEVEWGRFGELVSVFLSPDEVRGLAGLELEERERGQRLDGVIRFGERAVVVIESKTVEEAAYHQAVQLRREGAIFAEERVVQLGWHTLLEDWWSLLEKDLLGPAERVLLDDLIALGEQHFPWLMPFTTLGRAAGNDRRIQRRLMTLLREATGVDDVEAAPDGARIRVDGPGGAASTQRLEIHHMGDVLALRTWPGELKPQAEALYRTDRHQGLLDLAQRDEWQVTPNLHLAYRWAGHGDRIYLTCDVPIDEYVRSWAGDDFGMVGAISPDEVPGKLWSWLRERGYAAPGDDDGLEAFLERLGRRDALLRPGVDIRRNWRFAEAVQLDERGVLVDRLREAGVELWETLREPLPQHAGAAAG